MRIRNHWLQGAIQKETPNTDGFIEPQYLVFHFTAGRTAQASITGYATPDLKRSGGMSFP